MEAKEQLNKCNKTETNHRHREIGKDHMARRVMMECTLQNIISCTLGGKSKVLKHGLQCVMLDNRQSCSQMSVCVHVQLCPTRCNPMDCSLPGCSVHGIPRQEY